MHRHLSTTLSITLALLSSFPASAQQAQKLSKSEYVEQYKMIAIKEMHRTGIPASITLAQGILESSFGNSELATNANNHFGIKCHSDWRGKKVFYDDDKKHECFRKYASAHESFIDHSDFISNGRRYGFLFEYGGTDYKSWANGLKKAGYATNPTYPKLLINIIEQEDLDRYDKVTKKNVDDLEQPIIHDHEYGIFVFNRIKTILARKGDSPISIASTHDINLSRVMKYNDLDRDDQISPGDKIYLQPKRKRGDSKFHIVKEGEGLHAISQEHGIKMQWLLKRNLLLNTDELVAGEVLYLRGKRATPPQVKKPVGVRLSKYHSVKAGDTLYAIARKYKVSVDYLRNLNAMESSSLKVGEKIRIK